MRGAPTSPADRRRRAGRGSGQLTENLEPELADSAELAGSAELAQPPAAPSEHAPPARVGPAYHGPSGSSVLRRALLVWGSGHLALGVGQGWLLVAVQPLAVAALAALAALLLEGDRWIAVFPPLALFVAVWIGQAMHAQRLAVRRGAAGGGEYQVALALPVVVALLSGFWLAGGDKASPAATLQHYVSAWQAERPESAAGLFAEGRDTAALAAEWAAQRRHIERLVGEAAVRYGSLSGLDPARPFNSLRFEQASATAGGGTAIVDVDVVRRQRVETSLFGLIPTAAQETVLVERLGQVTLSATRAPLPAWLPLSANPGQVWLIEQVELATE